jgi:hypothetical protein
MKTADIVQEMGQGIYIYPPLLLENPPLKKGGAKIK